MDLMDTMDTMDGLHHMDLGSSRLDFRLVHRVHCVHRVHLVHLVHPVHPVHEIATSLHHPPYPLPPIMFPFIDNPRLRSHLSS
jgi:hypothetical protein